MKPRLYPCFLIAAIVTLLLVTAARADETAPSVIKFSDPAKPGILKIIISHGDLTIHGTDTAAITVKSDAQPITSAPREDGLRVLSSASSFTLTEENNVAVLTYGTEGWSGNSADFDLTVPQGTALVISSIIGGDVQIAGIRGDVEIKSVNGEIKLDGLGGGALVETMNGEIHASFAQLPAGKPLSFTSMNGEISVRLPADTKANVQLRTQNGTILTDFDDKVLVTKTEIARGHRTLSTKAKPQPNAAPVARAAEGDASSVESDTEWKQQVREAVREAARAGAEAAREAAQAMKEAAEAAHEGVAEANGAPPPPMPPMTGGKIVSGTLNGGGPDVFITTMNGDVTLRKLK